MVETNGAKQNVTFPSNGSDAHGYLALPPTGSGPGVLVIQEWWGLTSHIADVTERIAREGFVALAPDLYGGPTTHDASEAQELMGNLPEEQATRELAGAVDFLLAHEAVTGQKVGAVGFCMGGGFVLSLAAQQGDRIAAAAPFYGLVQGEPDFSGLTAEVLGSFGSQDKFVPQEAAETIAKTIETQSGRSVTFDFYPAGHAFFNDENLLGTYDPASAATAWAKTIAFLHRTLG